MITRGHPVGAVGVRVIALPHQETIVMLGDGHHVTRAGSLKQIGPIGYVDAIGALAKFFDEALIGAIAIDLGVMLCGGTALERPRVEIPLGVWARTERLGPVVASHEVAHVVLDRRITRNRVWAPVNEDAELGVFIPIWNWTICKREPGFRHGDSMSCATRASIAARLRWLFLWRSEWRAVAQQRSERDDHRNVAVVGAEVSELLGLGDCITGVQRNHQWAGEVLDHAAGASDHSDA